jgi:hypothetical protein
MIAAMLGTILPNLSDRFHLTPTQNGTIAFAQALGLIIASVGVGPLKTSTRDSPPVIGTFCTYFADHPWNRRAKCHSKYLALVSFQAGQILPR